MASVFNTSAFLQTVKRYADMHRLFENDGIYLVALSGGADSVALLHTLCALGIKTEAAHCNFHLRGEESERDEQFCKELCQKLAVPLHIAHFDTTSYALMHHVSIEMAARTLRYSYFNNLCNDISANGICVAHHQDDSTETLLLNLLRGTGIHGLRGIMPRNGRVLRPLLCVGRQDIEQYLRALHQSYVTDSTNLIDDVKRNKIRLNVLPLLQTINPSARKAIAQTAQHVAEACAFFDAAMEKAIQTITISADKDNKTYETNKTSSTNNENLIIDICTLLKQPSPEYVLFMALKERGFTPTQVQEIYSAISKPTINDETTLTLQSGRLWSSDTHELLIDRGRLIIEPKTTTTFKTKTFPEEGTYVIDECGTRLRITKKKNDEHFVLNKKANYACLDANKISWPLQLRIAQNADRFVPFGMRHSKLISDFLTDKKKSVFEKRRQLVLTMPTKATDTILWVVNERIDGRFSLSPNTTDVLEIVLLAEDQQACQCQ